MRNPEREVQHFRARVLVASAFVVSAFAILVGRFAWLQVVKHEAYLEQAELNRIAVLPVAPNRGLIKDRNGAIIARNYSAYTLEITPAKVDNLEQTIDELSKVVDIQPRDRRRFKKLLEDTKRFDSVPIRTRLSDQDVARFTANRFRFPGVELRARLFRYRLGFIPGDFGVMAFGDAGRVWNTGESSSRLHWGGGGGLWIAPTLAFCPSKIRLRRFTPSTPTRPGGLALPASTMGN